MGGKRGQCSRDSAWLGGQPAYCQIVTPDRAKQDDEYSNQNDEDSDNASYASSVDLDEPAGSDDEFDLEDQEDVPDDKVEDVSQDTTKDEDNINVLVNFADLKKAIRETFVCKICCGDHPPTITQTTTGLATRLIILPCPTSCHAVLIEPTRAATPCGKTNAKAIYAYAINLCAVLMAQFLGKGTMNGIGMVAAMLGLPKICATSAGWRETERVLGEAQETVARQCCTDNLDKEVQATLDDGIKARTTDDRVPIAISTDMGWQKKGSGRSYSSNSGHNIGIGCRTQGIVDYLVKAKLCGLCEAAKKGGFPPNFHRCVANFVGHSKSMEAISTVEMAVRLYDKKATTGGHTVWVNWHLTDDDTSCRANMKTFTKKSERGKLPARVTPPSFFYTDPTHRTRIFGKDLWQLVDKWHFKSGNAERLKRFYGYALKQYHNEPIPSFVMRMLAVIEHPFNNHMFCDSKWCRYTKRKKKDEEEEPPNPQVDQWQTPFLDENDIELSSQSPDCDNNTISLTSNNEVSPRATLVKIEPGTENEKTEEKGEHEVCLFWNKAVNQELYMALLAVIGRHTHPNKLRQLLHEFTSQKNEALNSSIAKLAPKDLTLSKTPTLGYRVAIVVGVDSIGWLEFCRRVFKEIDQSISLTPSLTEFLKVRQKRKEYFAARQASKAVKQRRRQMVCDKIGTQRNDEAKATKKHLTYSPGMGLDLDEDNNKKKRKQTDEEQAKKICGSCGLPGHSRMTSKLCKNYGKPKDAEGNEMKGKAKGNKKRKKRGESNMICPHCAGIGHERVSSKDCKKNPKNIIPPNGGP
jgi:hypothetical protein